MASTVLRYSFPFSYTQIDRDKQTETERDTERDINRERHRDKSRVHDPIHLPNEKAAVWRERRRSRSLAAMNAR